MSRLASVASACAELGLEWRAGEDAGEVSIPDGEPIGVRIDDEAVVVTFAGWEERTALDADGEALEFAVDFVVAAAVGELRVRERRWDGAVVERRLEVCVHGAWRVHERRGAPSLRARVAGWIGRGSVRERSNAGRMARPRRWLGHGPTGLAAAPWAGAAVHPREAAPAQLPTDGELDLHNFSPKEVAPLVRAYIEACRARGVLDLRIVHGKGKGVLRRTVHAQLERHDAVAEFRLGGHGEGSWGATIVRLRPPDDGDAT